MPQSGPSGRPVADGRPDDAVRAARQAWQEPQARQELQARQALDELQERAAARAADLQRAFDGLVEATEGSNVDDEHDPEGATIAFERSQLAAALDRATGELAEVAAALDRLAAATYGRCEVCRAQIPAGRLAARPTATRCVTCAG